MAANPKFPPSKKLFQRRLTEAQQVFLVTRTAVWMMPIDIMAEFKQEFGIEIVRQVTERYDPTKYNGRRLSEKLRTIFEETRKQFLENVAAVPISHKAVRLNELQKLFEKQRDKQTPNPAICMSILEQAAKEVGEAFTNRQKLEHTGKDGETLPPAQATVIVLPSNGRD